MGKALVATCSYTGTFSAMGNRGAPNAVAEIGEITGRSPALSTAFTAREVEDGSCGPRLRAFAQALVDAKEQSGSARQAEWSPRAA